MRQLRVFTPEDLKLEQQITDVHALPNQPLAQCTVKRIDSGTGGYASSL